MAFDSDYVQQMATRLATFQVQGAEAKAVRNQKAYQAQQKALGTLNSALQSFKSAVLGLRSGGKSMLVNSATFSQDGYASAKVATTAVPGSYQFFVKQLASSHQVALEGLSDADVPSSGTLTIGQGAASFSVDLSAIDSDGNGSNSLAELANAINKAADNTGVSATLVRSNGTVSLVLGSTRSGVDGTISLSGSLPAGAFDDALANPRELSVGRDAIVMLGGENGIELTSTSNTFENIVDGVSLTFSKAHQSGDSPLGMTIGQDQAGTKAQAQAFIDAFNALMSSFDSLTASGSKSDTRGPLAGDASVRSIESMLNQVVRTAFGGKSLTDFGILADRNGKLTIDAARFEKAVAADPTGFDKLFTDKDSLIDSLDKNLALYTNSVNGVLKNRRETLDAMLRRVDQQFETIDKQYELYYNRYLRQYSNLMQTMAEMNQTYGMFG